MTWVTFCSSVDASAPGYTTLIARDGGATSGYCSIGKARRAMNPDKRMASEMTHAKMGLSMK